MPKRFSAPKRRIMPVSASAARKGFEEVFSDTDGESFAKCLNRFKRQAVLLDHITSIGLMQVAALCLPDSDPDQKIGNADMNTMIGGAAVYYACLRKEAGEKRTAFPRITQKDVRFWVGKYFASEELHLAGNDMQAVVSTSRDFISDLASAATEFDMKELDFSTQALDYFAPERGYTPEFRHDFSFGASLVYTAFDAHYSLAELEQAAR